MSPRIEQTHQHHADTKPLKCDPHKGRCTAQWSATGRAESGGFWDHRLRCPNDKCGIETPVATIAPLLAGRRPTRRDQKLFAPVVLMGGFSSDEHPRKIIPHRHHQIRKSLVVDQSRVERGTGVLDQTRFHQEGFPLPVTLDGVDGIDFGQHRLLLGPQLCRRHEVRRDAVFEAPGFAHIQDMPIHILHQIHPRPLGEGLGQGRKTASTRFPSLFLGFRRGHNATLAVKRAGFSPPCPRFA